MKKLYYRINELSDILSMGKSTIWNLMAEGKFPQSIKISHGVTVWKSEDILKWVDANQGEAPRSKITNNG
jgi:prophage regulatory protein